jgi:LAO/AO transport system kinase
MLDLSNLGEWRPPILPTVGSSGQGVPELWQAVVDHRRHAEKTGLLEERRRRRLRDELRTIVISRLDARARELCGGERYEEVEAAVLDRRVDPWSAADELLQGVGG